MYFREFPLYQYDFEGKGQSVKLVTDILRRVKVRDGLKNETSTFDKYQVIAGETPEIVSYKLYETVDYYWVILVCNNIIDPYHDWPKSNLDLAEFAKQRYGAENLGKIHHYVDSTNEDIENYLSNGVCQSGFKRLN